MKTEFFKMQSEYKGLKKKGNTKIVAGIFFIAIGLLIFFAEPSYIANGNYYAGGFGSHGNLYIYKLVTLNERLITLLYLTLGKWNSSAIFYLIELIFIIWGIRDLKKNIPANLFKDKNNLPHETQIFGLGNETKR